MAIGDQRFDLGRRRVFFETHDHTMNERRLRGFRRLLTITCENGRRQKQGANNDAVNPPLHSLLRKRRASERKTDALARLQTFTWGLRLDARRQNQSPPLPFPLGLAALLSL